MNLIYGIQLYGKVHHIWLHFDPQYLLVTAIKRRAPLLPCMLHVFVSGYSGNGRFFAATSAVTAAF